MTLLKDNNYKEINIALLSLEADIKKLSSNNSNFNTDGFDAQLADINKRIDEINGLDETVVKNLKNDVIAINSNIDNIEQQLSNIFTAENKVTDFNTTTNSGIYYWSTDSANKPGTDYGVLLVNKYSTWINQIAYGTNGKIYFRQNINSGNWTAWKAIAFDGEMNADTVDNYHASQLWRSDGATWNPSANVTMTPSGNNDEWSFDFRNKNGTTGSYWQVWDENKQTLLKVNADDGKVSAPYGFVGNLSGKSTKSSFLDEYVGAGGTRLTSGNIVPKDSSEYGGMRKDVVTSSMTDSGRPGMDGQLLTMFWDNSGRWDNQLFISNDLNIPPILKVRQKLNETDYGPWVDIITSNNIGSQTVSRASTAGTADNLTAGAALTSSNKITTTNPTKIGVGQIKVHTVYDAGGPAKFGNIINIGGNGGFQFFVEWKGSQNQAGQDLIGRIFTRFWRDNQSAWTAWQELAYNNADVTFNTAKASSKMVIPVGEPATKENGCIWIG